MRNIIKLCHNFGSCSSARIMHSHTDMTYEGPSCLYRQLGCLNAFLDIKDASAPSLHSSLLLLPLMSHNSHLVCGSLLSTQASYFLLLDCAGEGKITPEQVYLFISLSRAAYQTLQELSSTESWH